MAHTSSPPILLLSQMLLLLLLSPSATGTKPSSSSYPGTQLSGDGKRRKASVGTPHQEVELNSQPTQFEVALLRTLQAVREGRAPDPKLRKADGTPGTLLDALLPETESEQQKVQKRRELAAGWRFLGANIPFLQGPTLAALNASFYRYASIALTTANSRVDWRDTVYITDIQAQYDCASCWAMSAADTVAMVTAIAENRVGVTAGVQQICDCSGMGCCSGGWPEDAFGWMVTNSNITTNAFYNYVALEGDTCAVGSNYPVAGKITGWERVPMHSQDALMQAVNMHPVLVYISASSRDVQQYTSTAPGTPGFNIYDGACSTEVNHAMVVVGYDVTGRDPYWILKNSWIKSGWGHNGYMYLIMRDGPGKCGMQTVNPIYPVYYPNAPLQATVQQGTYPASPYSGWWWDRWRWVGNPCVGIINPCGAGTCYKDVNSVARCRCTWPFVELVGVPTSKCLHPSPCTSSLFNPCGAGWCMDVGDGSYLCGCPTGFAVGTRTNGASTCVPVSSLNVRSRTYVVQYGDSCWSISTAYGISASRFAILNPFLRCSFRLVPGLVVALEPSSSVICTQQYAIRPGDSCGTVAYYMDRVSYFRPMMNPSFWSGTPSLLNSVYSLSDVSWWSPASLRALNPALNCSALYSSEQICVTGTNVNTSAVPLTCSQTYITQDGEGCYDVRSRFGLTSTAFRGLNPGLNCAFNGGNFYAGVQLCVASAANTQAINININCTQWYTVQQGDTCAQIWNAANMSQYQLLYINPGLQCQPPFLYVGLQVCIDSPLLANISDPSYLTYTVQPNDTWATIQAQFTAKCQAYSITIDRIAEQNGISDWLNYNLSSRGVLPLVIPCVYKVGAACGCVDSLPVCGATLVTYNSYCEARCNFATPTTDGACSACQMACSGRYGARPSPLSACPEDYLCPWPQWPPSLSDSAAIFSPPSQLCKYRFASCVRICAIANFVNNRRMTDTVCFNACYACFRVPCSGPSVAVGFGFPPCEFCNSTIASPGCAASGKSGSACSTDCTYFNTLWSPLNP